MTRSGHYLAAAVLIMCTAGCDESLRDFAGPTPDLEPTFSSIQRDIFSTTDSAGRAACTSCHNAPGPRLAERLESDRRHGVRGPGQRRQPRQAGGDPRVPAIPTPAI